MHNPSCHLIQRTNSSMDRAAKRLRAGLCDVPMATGDGRSPTGEIVQPPHPSCQRRIVLPLACRTAFFRTRSAVAEVWTPVPDRWWKLRSMHSMSLSRMVLWSVCGQDFRDPAKLTHLSTRQDLVYWTYYPYNFGKKVAPLGILGNRTSED